jgi:A118 family predicted phage portal protein
VPITYGPQTAWPPADVAELAPVWLEWSTWYRGKADELSVLYTDRGPNYVGGYGIPPSQRQGGLVGWINRIFWGRQSATGSTKLHVPAAADVAALSAAMLFAEPPTFAVPEAASGKGKTKSNPTQDRLDKILQEAGVYATLHAAADRASAYGGVYLRASANVNLADMPIVEAILPDTAVPEFYGPFLTAVTFFTRLTAKDEPGPVYRHLERHEMLGAGARRRCVIFHELRKGDNERLGRAVPLNDRPETEHLAAFVDADGMIDIGTSLLDVVYVPNMQPMRGYATQQGRSDYDSVVPQMDALDEAWTSWMRDIRIGKGRIIVPRGYVRRQLQDGDGGAFDLEQEVYAAVNAQPGNADSAQLAITASQFEIRTEEHKGTTDELWKIIYKGAGLDGTEQGSENVVETATGVNAKAGRKRSTRSVKIGYWTPALRRLASVLLQLDVIAFRTAGLLPGAPVEIEFPDVAAPDPESLARTIQLLDAARAISQRTKVEMLHRDWDADQVETEIAEIEAGSVVVEDPADPNAIDEPDETDPQDDTQPVDEGAPNGQQA